MAKKIHIFGKTFTGCTDGEVYPSTFKAGDAVPVDLVSAAKAEDAIETDAKKATALAKQRSSDLKGEAADKEQEE